MNCTVACFVAVEGLFCTGLFAQEPAGPAPDQWQRAAATGGGVGGVFERRAPAESPQRPAIASGLVWLRQHSVDGHWVGADATDQRTAVLVTGLALLAFLGDGNTMRTGPHKDAIKTGVVWLRDLQAENGSFLPKGDDDAFAQAVACTALGEAYLLSNYKLLQPVFGRSLGITQMRRQPSGAFAAAGQQPDMALTLWSQFAQMTGEFAGATENADRKPLSEWLGSDDADRLLERSLLPVNEQAGADLELRHELDAARLLAKCFAAVAVAPEATGADKVRARVRKWKPGVSLHEWFCASHLVHQIGTGAAVDEVLEPLLAGQCREGPHAGSWDPIDLCGAVGGRSWSTAMAVLTLQAKQRYGKRFP